MGKTEMEAPVHQHLDALVASIQHLLSAMSGDRDRIIDKARIVALCRAVLINEQLLRDDMDRVAQHQSLQDTLTEAEHELGRSQGIVQGLLQHLVAAEETLEGAVASSRAHLHATEPLAYGACTETSSVASPTAQRHALDLDALVAYGRHVSRMASAPNDYVDGQFLMMMR